MAPGWSTRAVHETEAADPSTGGVVVTAPNFLTVREDE